MKKFVRFVCVAVGVLAVLALQGCATSIKASSTQNPPPKEAFSAFGKIELKTVVFKAGTKGDIAGLSKIDENLKSNLKRSLEEWNGRPANGRSLTIEPVIQEMAFQHGAKRVLLGPMAGSSGVLIRLNIRDANGREVASPEFFQRADAWSAGFVVGVHDNLMLTRVAQLASNYVIGNYARAQGGPTGADEKAVAPN